MLGGRTTPRLRLARPGAGSSAAFASQVLEVFDVLLMRETALDQVRVTEPIATVHGNRHISRKMSDLRVDPVLFEHDVRHHIQVGRRHRMRNPNVRSATLVSTTVCWLAPHARA